MDLNYPSENESQSMAPSTNEEDYNPKLSLLIVVVANGLFLLL